MFAVMMVLTAVVSGEAENIDLSTVPPRRSVQLTIYNGADITMVRDTRLVTFKKGDNPLEFSSAGTLIDPSSVHIAFPGHDGKLSVRDTMFPHDKKQTLYWHVQSKLAGQAKVRITYFTSGISWSGSYQAIVNHEANSMHLKGFVTVTNNSGEDYDHAHVRLIVGTINMVQEIRRLAKEGIIAADQVNQPAPEQNFALRGRVLKMAAAASDAASFGGRIHQAKRIVKEGLSEYFMFTIPGTETVPNNWSKRLRSFDAADVPVSLPYRYWPQVYGSQLVRVLAWKNDKASHLGDSPLPNGTVHVYQDQTDDSLTYLGSQSIKYVPIADKVDVSLGADPNVGFKLVPLRVFRDHIWARFKGVDVLHRIDGPGGIKIRANSDVVGWDEHQVKVQEIRNDTDHPIDVQVRRTYSGDVAFLSDIGASLHDYHMVAYERQVAAGHRADLAYEVITKQGRNSKQDRVTLARGSAHLPAWYKKPGG